MELLLVPVLELEELVLAEPEELLPAEELPDDDFLLPEPEEELLFFAEEPEDLLPPDLDEDELFFVPLLLREEEGPEDFFGAEDELTLVLAVGDTAVRAKAGAAGTENAMTADNAAAAIRFAVFHFPYGVSAMVFRAGSPAPECWE